MDGGEMFNWYLEIDGLSWGWVGVAKVASVTFDEEIISSLILKWGCI